MSKLFLRPNWLHDPDNVLSATTEAGVGPGVSTPSTSNAGSLRLRQAGIPSAAVALDVALQTGGNPYGYTPDDYGQGAGASLRFKNTSDGSTSWRGYIDSIYLRQVVTPLSYNSGFRPMSQPRQLSNGDLGWAALRNTAMTFYRMSSANAVTSVTLTGSADIFSSTASAGIIPTLGMAVLPSGRIVLLAPLVGTGYQLGTVYSDDNGATWAPLSSGAALVSTYFDGDVQLEFVDGLLVAVISDSTGGPEVWVSRDGGARFTLVDTGASTKDGIRTCVTLDGTILTIQRSTTNAQVGRMTPGGGYPTTLVAANVGDRDEIQAIATRDDGTVWAIGWHATATRAMEMQLSVSLDHGASFSSAVTVLDTHDVPAATPILQCQAAFWRGNLVVLVQTNADTGSDNNCFLLVFGGWATVTDVRTITASDGQPYEHTYFPYDVPDAGPWALNNIGAGATISNQGPLNIVGTVANNSYYSANGTFWSGASGDSKRIRFRCRVNSGGSTSADYAILRWHITDGANCQQVKLQFASTGFRVVDGAGNVLATITAAMTGWCDIVAFYQHESSANTGRVTIYYRLDSDTETVWTLGVSNAAVAESVGAGNQLYFGGTAAGVVNWDVLLVAVADDDCGFAEGFGNPADLAGRPVPAETEMWVSGGLLLGAFSGFGVAGDSYTVETLASYGKENIWAELRPSRRCQSTADGSSWAVVFDAGPNNLWHVKDVAVFGTNARQISYQMNATDSWGAPSVSQALTVTAETFTADASNRGKGYVGPAASPTWRPHQWRSDGDGHRWFAQVGDNVYEITDNDADRLYIADVDLSAASGTVYIFGDRGGYTHASTVNRYRYLRILFAAQDTADGAYRLGTVVVGQGYTPAQDYSWNHIDAVEPAVVLTVTEAGQALSARRGPRRKTIRVQWEAVNALNTTSGEVGRQIEDLYAALEGEHTPVVFWRDTTDITTLGLYRLTGVLQRPNRLGELGTALGSIDPIELREEL